MKSQFDYLVEEIEKGYTKYHPLWDPKRIKELSHSVAKSFWIRKYGELVTSA